MRRVSATEVEVGGVYLSQQKGFRWRFEVLGVGPKRIRAIQSSTAGGYTARGRLLTPKQWDEYHCYREKASK